MTEYGDAHEGPSVATLISKKLDFQSKSIKRYGEAEFTLIKGKIDKDSIAILNIYAPNKMPSTFEKIKNSTNA